MIFPLITDPFFYAVSIPAVLLLGISKSGFGAGFGFLPLLVLPIKAGLEPLVRLSKLVETGFVLLLRLVGLFVLRVSSLGWLLLVGNNSFILRRGLGR